MKGHRLSAKASKDLRLIATAIASRYSEASADVALDRVLEICRLLGRHPLFGRARDRDLGPGIRSIPAGLFIVIYRVTRSGVLILRVVDGRRDYRGLFRP